MSTSSGSSLLTMMWLFFFFFNDTATTEIYTLSLHDALPIYGYDVFPDLDRRQPFGSGATCSYPNIDLQIKNDTDQRFQLSLHLTDTHLVGAWRSDRLVPYEFQIVEKNHRFTSTWCGGDVRCN